MLLQSYDKEENPTFPFSKQLQSFRAKAAFLVLGVSVLFCFWHILK